MSWDTISPYHLGFREFPAAHEALGFADIYRDALRADAAGRHAHPRPRWLDDRLPALSVVHRRGLGFDLVWLSGVWMHVLPDDRARAMRKLAMLLKPGGRMVLTLRHGPAPCARGRRPPDREHASHAFDVCR